MKTDSYQICSILNYLSYYQAFSVIDKNNNMIVEVIKTLALKLSRLAEDSDECK